MLVSHLESYCYNHGINFGNYNVDTLPGIKSVSHCQFECQKAEACFGFSYNRLTADCVRKAAQALPTQLAHGDFVSGNKFCMKNVSECKFGIIYGKSLSPYLKIIFSYKNYNLCNRSQSHFCLHHITHCYYYFIIYKPSFI